MQRRDALLLWNVTLSQVSGCHLFPFLWASHPPSSFKPLSGSPWSSAPTHSLGGFWVSKASEKIRSLLKELGLQQHQSLLEEVAGPNPILLLPPLIRNMTLSKFYLWNTVCRCGSHLLIHLAERQIKGSFRRQETFQIKNTNITREVIAHRWRNVGGL